MARSAAVKRPDANVRRASGTRTNDTPANGTPANGTPANGTPANGTRIVRRTGTSAKPGSDTPSRILDAALQLFNRFGEPNVSTAQLAADVGISAGNLHYHFPAKEGLVNALVAAHETQLADLLDAGGGVRDVEDAWFFLHTLFERMWACRFLYRDLNGLLTRNRALESSVPLLLDRKRLALAAMLHGLCAQRAARIDTSEVDATATSMLVVLTWWLSYEYARAPRHALEDTNAEACMLRGARHVLHLLVPYLTDGQREHLMRLVAAYDNPAVQQ